MRTAKMLALLCAVSLTGCLESEAVLELNPSGGGTLTVDVTLDLASSTEHLQAEGLSREAAANLAAVDVLSHLQGIDCWTDLESTVTEAGRIRLKGKAWFRDAGALSLKIGDQEVNCSLEVGATEGALRIIDRRGSRLALALLQYGPRALEQIIRRRFGDIPPALRQLTIQVPGSVKGASYSWQARDASGGMLEDTPAGWQGLLERYQTKVARLEEAGKIGGEGDDGSLLEQTQRLFAIPKLRWTIDPAAGEGSAAAFEAAMAAWAISEWRALFNGETPVAAADPVQPEPIAEPDAGGAPEETPDPFEDNDAQTMAAAIGAGTFQDLRADGQDWFQLEIQPGQTLKVGVEKAPAANLGILLLAGGNLRRGSDGVEWSNSAGEPRIAQFVITGRGFYHLNVAVE